MNFLRNAPSWARAASTQAGPGLSTILQRNRKDVVLTFAKRTAMGKAKKGQFKDVPVDEMLRALFKATLDQTQIDPAIIEDICVGTCHPPSPVYASRAAALAAGIPASVPISTVNRLCSSGLMAIRSIAHAISFEEIEVGMAVGVENMTLHPRPTPVVTNGVEVHPQAKDCVQPMGWTSEMVAQTYQVPRAKQDEYALISHTRAYDAQRRKLFASEILPIRVKCSLVTVDDTIRAGVTMASLASLQPAFPQWGDSTTAGNASGIGDGAAICIITTRERAEQEGWDVLGKWIGATVVGVDPRYMGIAPIVAIPKILAQVGLTKNDVDVYEINEAFASQFAYCVEQLQIPIEKINPHGGAIALTHPLGMTGIRQVLTGLAELERKGKRVLCTSMCIGSGMGAAGIFVNERL